MKAFACSRRTMNNSKRSVKRPSCGFFLANGEISTGWPKINVGWTNDSSTFCSKNSLSTCPTSIEGLTSTPCSFAKAWACSFVISTQKSTPVISLTASAMCSRFQPGDKSISSSPYITFVVPRTSCATCAITFSVNAMMSL